MSLKYMEKVPIAMHISLKFEVGSGHSLSLPQLHPPWLGCTHKLDIRERRLTKRQVDITNKPIYYFVSLIVLCWNVPRVICSNIQCYVTEPVVQPSHK